MSQDSFNAFKAQLEATETLREEMSRAVGTNGSIDDLVAFARARGYDFDSTDIRRGLELNDEELDAVAAGTADQSVPKLMQACTNGVHLKEVTLI